MFYNNLISNDNILVRSEIITTKFACELSKCKGACCTLESEYGAPILVNEIDEIEKSLPYVFDYLEESNINEIKRKGFYEKKSGELFLRSIQNRDCVFVYYENDIAKCSIEKAFLDRKTNFRKPISCHLFPIRVSKFGGDILRYEKFAQCEPALENGKKKDITIVEFCRESLIRLYGEKWYSQLIEKSSR